MEFGCASNAAAEHREQGWPTGSGQRGEAEVPGRMASHFVTRGHSAAGLAQKITGGTGPKCPRHERVPSRVPCNSHKSCHTEP